LAPKCTSGADSSSSALGVHLRTKVGQASKGDVMKEIERFATKKQAETLLRFIAAEVGARYDPVTERYNYSRDKKLRQLYIERDQLDWRLVLEEQPDAT